MPCFGEREEEVRCVVVRVATRIDDTNASDDDQPKPRPMNFDDVGREAAASPDRRAARSATSRSRGDRRDAPTAINAAPSELPADAVGDVEHDDAADRDRRAPTTNWMRPAGLRSLCRSREAASRSIASTTRARPPSDRDRCRPCRDRPTGAACDPTRAAKIVVPEVVALGLVGASPTWIWSTISFEKPSLAPVSTKNVPSVTMKLGSFVRLDHPAVEEADPDARRQTRSGWRSTG